MDYNMHTVIRFYRNEDDEVCAYVQKDRTGIHPSETLVDPQLLDWQQLIDNSIGKTNFVLNNNLDTAVTTEQEIYSAEVMTNAAKSLSKSDVEKMKMTTDDDSSDMSDVKDLQTKIKNIIGKMDPVAKKEMKTNLEAAGLPTTISKVTDIDILNKILEVVSA